MFGVKAYKEIDAVPGEIDHAYILLNGKDAVAALAACAKRGVKVASILAGGFADAGAAGASLQDELVRIVKETGIRLVGPNSIGTVSTDPPMVLTANAAFAVDKLRAGNWGLVSQSGSLIGALLSRADARGIGFSRLISVGNEVDLAVGEIADLLVDDPKTKAILLFMETLRDGERLARAARRAMPPASRSSPTSSAAPTSARSWPSRTPARSPAPMPPSTPSAAATASRACRCSNRWSTCRPCWSIVRRATGKRVAVATTTGGGAAMVVDNMAMAGLDIADPPQALVDWLKPLGIAAGEGKLVDLTLAGAKPEIVAGTIERLLADDANDAAIFIVGSSAQFDPELAVEPLLRFAGSPAIRRGADAGGGEVAGAADGGRRASLPASRVLRRGDGALPAAADASAGRPHWPSRTAPRSKRSRPADVGFDERAGGGTFRRPQRADGEWSPCPTPSRHLAVERSGHR